MNFEEFIKGSTRQEKQVLQQATKICDKKGVRLTPPRQVVLLLIHRAVDGIKAYDLLREIRQMLPKAAPAVVYRPLHFLLQTSLIYKVNSCQLFKFNRLNAYIAASALFVCPLCNKQSLVEDQGLMQALYRLLKVNHYAAEENIVEIVAHCESCAK